jgi:protein ImuA
LNIERGRVDESEARIAKRQAPIANSSHAPLLFLDPDGTLYPPALVRMGLDLSRVYLLRPKTREEGLWAMAECLRCAGVGAVVARVEGLSRVEARRLQLAAEGGGTVGVLMRPAGKTSAVYAAATRWQVEAVAGDRTVQRWRIQLVHGHGGRVGQDVYVEQLRQAANTLRATSLLGHRPGDAEVGVA